MRCSIIGFVGTTDGMTSEQLKTFQMLMEKEGRNTILHHGDLIGAGIQAHVAAKRLGCRTVLHPDIVEDFRAYCHNATGAWEPTNSDERNDDIVDCCNHLIAAPKEMEEQRNQIWTTIRYAIQIHKQVTVIWPNGSTESIVTLPLKVNREVKNVSGKYLGQNKECKQ